MNGEGDGTPLQYSCLENPRDGGAWWAAVYGVVQSQTRLKQFSSIDALIGCFILFVFFFECQLRSQSGFQAGLLLLIRFSRVQLCATP